MKNSNLTKKMTALLKGVFVTALVTSALVACGNKNNNTTQPVNAYTQSCTNCQNITGYPFFSAQTQAYSAYGNYYGYYGGTAAATISWSFSGQNTSSSATGQSYNQYASPAMNYVGQVSVAGQLNVTTSLGSSNFCPAIPAGSYTITTQTVGQWANGQISGLRLLITGPNVNAVATVNQAQAYEYGYGYYNSGASNSRVTGSIMIESNNGYYCQGLQLNLY